MEKRGDRAHTDHDHFHPNSSFPSLHDGDRDAADASARGSRSAGGVGCKRWRRLSGDSVLLANGVPGRTTPGRRPEPFFCARVAYKRDRGAGNRSCASSRGGDPRQPQASHDLATACATGISMKPEAASASLGGVPCRRGPLQPWHEQTIALAAVGERQAPPLSSRLPWTGQNACAKASSKLRCSIAVRFRSSRTPSGDFCTRREAMIASEFADGTHGKAEPMRSASAAGYDDDRPRAQQPHQTSTRKGRRDKDAPRR
eukprot:scaffold1051_cov254-Pinguiococcus_pyrenoidosus.AAC.15